MYEQGGQMFPYAVEMERPLYLEEGRDYELEIQSIAGQELYFSVVLRIKSKNIGVQ